MTEDLRRGLEDDGLYTPKIKAHSLKKIRIHDYYVSVFSTSMKKRWPQRAYLGLYSGPGRAEIEYTGEIVETTALSALRMKYPFTKYIFVDNDPRCIEALAGRIAALPRDHDVELIQADVTEATPQILSAMPSFSLGRGLLSFCFIDPFSADLDFEVIRRLSRYKMDFLILLMLGRDVRTNFRRYLEDPEDTRIARLIDDPDWRDEWVSKGMPERRLIRFLLGKFDEAMTRLGYEGIRPGEAHDVRIKGKNVYLYSLVLYSRDRLAKKFWRETLKGTDEQFTLGL